MIDCEHCSGGGYEETVDEKNRLSVIPCRHCQPSRHKDWAEGHNRSDHDFTHCDWVMCKQRAEKAEKEHRPKSRRTEKPLVPVVTRDWTEPQREEPEQLGW